MRVLFFCKYPKTVCWAANGRKNFQRSVTLALVGFGAFVDWQQGQARKRPGSLVIRGQGVELLRPDSSTFLPWDVFDADRKPIAGKGVLIYLRKGTEHQIIRRRSNGVVVDDGLLAGRHWAWLVGRRILIPDVYGIDPKEIGQLIIRMAPVMAAPAMVVSCSGADREKGADVPTGELVIEGLPRLHRATFRLGDGETRSVLTRSGGQLDPLFYQVAVRRWPMLIRALGRWHAALWVLSVTAGTILAVALLAVIAPWAKGQGVNLPLTDAVDVLPVRWLLGMAGLQIIAILVISFKVDRATRQLVEQLEGFE